MRVSVNDEISKYLSIKRNRRGCVHPVEFRCRTTKRRPASYNLQEMIFFYLITTTRITKRLE